MFRNKYLVLIACILLGFLVIAAPVAAAQSYSVSVTSYGSGPSSLSAAKQAFLAGHGTGSTTSAYQGISSQKMAALAGLQASGTSAAQGSVSAYTKFSSYTNHTSMTFSDSVSVSGEIFSFEYTTTFN